MKTNLITRILKRFSGLIVLAFLFTISVSSTVNAAAFYFDQSNTNCDLISTEYLWMDNDCWDDATGAKWGSTPGSSDDVFFDSSSGSGNVGIYQDVSILYLKLDAGYSGVITGHTDPVIDFNVSGSVDLLDGIFNFGGMTVDINGDLFLGAAGATTFSSNNTYLAGDFTVVGLSTFVNGGGTVIFDGNSNATFYDFDGDSYLYNIKIDKGTGSLSGSNWDADAAANVKGNFTMTSGTYSVDASLAIVGTYTQTGGTFSQITSTGGTYAVSVGGTYSQSAGTFTAPSGGDMTVGSTLNLSGGTFNGSKKILNIAGALQVNSTGIFVGNSGNIDVAGSWTLSNVANFTANTGVLYVGGNISMGASVIFDSNNGYVRMDSPAAAQVITKYNSGSFNILEISMANASAAVTVTGNIAVSGELILNDGSIAGAGQFDVSGDFYNYSTFSGGSTLVNITGTTAATALLKGTVPKLKIDNPNMVMSLAGTTTFSNTLEIAQGGLKSYVIDNTNLPVAIGGPVASANVIFQGVVTLTGGGILDNSSGEADPINGNTTFSSTLTLNGGNYIADEASTSTTVTFQNTVTLDSGSLDAGSGSLIFNGILVQGGGTFRAETAAQVRHNVAVYLNGGRYLGNTTNNIRFDDILALNGGSFEGDSSTITSNSTAANALDINSGTFIATSGTMTMSGGIDFETGATFTHNSGTFEFVGASKTLNMSSTAQVFNNFIINKDTASYIEIGNENTNGITVAGTLTLQNGQLWSYQSARPLNVIGGLDWQTTFDGTTTDNSTGYLYLQPSVDVTIPDGVDMLKLTFDSAGKTLHTSGTTALSFNTGYKTLTILDGNFDNSTANLDLTFASGANIYMNGTGTFDLGTGSLSAPDSLMTVAGGTFDATGATAIYLKQFDQYGGIYNGGAGPLSIGTNSMYISAGTHNAGSGAITIAGNLITHYYGTRDAIVDFSAASSIEITGVITMGYVSLSSGQFIASANTTTIHGYASKIESADVTFTHSNGTFVFDRVGGEIRIDGDDEIPFYNLTFSPSDGERISVNANMIAEGTLTINDGSCYNKILRSRGPFSYNTNADGGTCTIEFSSPDTHVHTITAAAANGTPSDRLEFGQPFPKLILNSATTTINLEDSPGETAYIYNYLSYAGTFNQNSANIDTFHSGAGDFIVAGGNFNTGAGPHDGDLYIYDQMRVESGIFNAPTGDVTARNEFRINYYGNKNGVANFSGANSLTTGGTYFYVGNSSGSTGSLTLPATTTTINNSSVTVYADNTDPLKTDLYHSNGKVIFNGIAKSVVGSPKLYLYDMEINLNDGAGFVHQNDFDIAGDLTFTDGECKNGNIWTVHGNLDYAATADGSGCVLDLVNPTPNTVINTAGVNFPEIRVHSSEITFNLTTTETAHFNRLRVYAGTFNQNDASIDLTTPGYRDMYMYGGLFNDPAAGPHTGAISINSIYTQSGGTFNGPTGNVVLESNLQVDGGTFNAGSGTYDIKGTLDFNGGTVDLSAALIRNISANLDAQGGAGSLFTLGTGTTTVAGRVYGDVAGTYGDAGTIEMVGSGNQFASGYFPYDNLTINKTNTTDKINFDVTNITLTGSLVLKKGLFDVNSKNLTVGGDFTVCPSAFGDTECQNAIVGDAEFIPETRTVTFNGTNQTIYGSNDHTFYNFTKIVTTADTLTFEAGEHQIMQGTTTLKGADGELLTLASTSTGSDWYFDPQGARDFDFLDVQDSYNHDHAGDGLVIIDTTGLNITNSGNNTNWLFPGPPVVSNLGPFIVTNGSTTQNTTPTFTFDIDDPVDLTVDYQIQIDDSSDFSSPVVDYTSALASEGSRTFTVGQAEGTGTYAVGSSPQTLTDGNYYWRVRSTNSQSDIGEYAEANGGEIAFIVDTVGPDAVVQVSPNGNTGDSTPVYLWRRITDDGGGYVITVKNSGDVEQYQITGINSGTSFTEAVALLSPGDYSWEIYAIDAAGNPGAVSSMDFTLINMIPEYDAYMYITVLLAGMGLIYWKRRETIEME